MRSSLIVFLGVSCAFTTLGQIHSSVFSGRTERLDSLIAEVRVANPTIRGANAAMDAAFARARQSGVLADPELRYMRMQMPGFKWNQAMLAGVEFMQMIRFPSKLATENALGGIMVDHARHEYLEKINEVVTLLKLGYYELWFVQQSMILNQENIRLLKQFTDIARTHYGVGKATQQDVLKAQVELAKMENEQRDLFQMETATKAMLAALLNRESDDSIGTAALFDENDFAPSLAYAEQLALEHRPMLKHDSLKIVEQGTMLSLARQELLPDFSVGIEYVTEPLGSFRGWSVRAGISLPFVPWTLGRSQARVEESRMAVVEATERYTNTRNMVVARVRQLVAKVQSDAERLKSYNEEILPQALQSLQASMAAYRTKGTDFLMLIDSYRMLVMLSTESLRVRMEFEQGIAMLEEATGIEKIVRSSRTKGGL